MDIQIKADVGDYVYTYPTFFTTPFKNGDKVMIRSIFRNIELVDYEINLSHIKRVHGDNYKIINKEDRAYIIYNGYLLEGHDTIYAECDFESSPKTLK